LKWKRTTAKCLNPCALLISKLDLALMKTIVVRVISLQCKGSLSENVETVRMHTGKLKSSWNVWSCYVRRTILQMILSLWKLC